MCDAQAEHELLIASIEITRGSSCPELIEVLPEPIGVEIMFGSVAIEAALISDTSSTSAVVGRICYAGRMDATSTNEAARALGARRKQVEKPCVICGTLFTGLKIQIYCSETCRWRQDKRRYRAKARSESAP